MNEIRHGGTGVVQWANTGFPGKAGREGCGEGFLFSMIKCLVCRNLPYVIGKRLAESLRARMREEITLWQECVIDHLIKMWKWTVA